MLYSYCGTKHCYAIPRGGDNMQYMSKKDLLKETEISYGQLYRWKRAGLIPEEWFIKRSSYTGQETVFPKDSIVERIKLIQDLKNKMSHEQIADMLAGRKREVDLKDLKTLSCLDAQITQIVMDDDDNLDMQKATLICGISKVKTSKQIDAGNFEISIKGWKKKGYPKNFRYMDVVIGEDKVCINFKKADTEILYDGDYRETINIDLDSIMQDINVEMNEKREV